VDRNKVGGEPHQYEDYADVGTITSEEEEQSQNRDNLEQKYVEDNLLVSRNYQKPDEIIKSKMSN